MTVDKSWENFFNTKSTKELLSSIHSYLDNELQHGKIILPLEKDRYKVFQICPFDAIKVVILGQDPYHQLNQANGLAFSVSKGIKIPPSLVNIYKALAAQIPEFQIPNHGDLSEWAKQGVFLLNASLSVEYDKAGSHANIGWQAFTDLVIKEISSKLNHVVFLLWGKHAQSKSALIDNKQHLIIQTSHPSPLSAYQGFLNSQQFKQANSYLIQHGKEPINWKLESNQISLF